MWDSGDLENHAKLTMQVIHNYYYRLISMEISHFIIILLCVIVDSKASGFLFSSDQDPCREGSGS